MIKALIFDFDGTLSNRMMNAYGVFEYYLRPYFKDFDEMEYEAVLQDLLTYDCNGTIPVRGRLIAFREKYGYYLPKTFEKDFTQYYYEKMCDYCVLGDGVIETLEALKGKYRMAILSNGDSKSQHDKIDALPLAEYFDEIFVSGDYDYQKPEPEIYEMVAKELGVECEECMMIGDVFSTDILGAVRAGMLPVWFTADYQRPSRYYQGYRISRLSEVLDILAKEERYEHSGNE
ncbi:MAG: HAD family hydrolase [Erysipelotrichaceae bacterium]|nr:HAD family hydrolase [Erysipelotrichaceae bacterium]